MKHKTNLESESLPEKVCVQLASEIEQQLLPKNFASNRRRRDSRMDCIFWNAGRRFF